MLAKVSAEFENIGAAALFLAGALMVLLGTIDETRESVAVTLVGFGSVLMPLAVLLPRIVGRIKLSAGGLETELTAVVKAEAKAGGVPDPITKRAVQLVRIESGEALRDRARELLSDAELLEIGSEMVEIGLENLDDSLRKPQLQDLITEVRTYRAQMAEQIHDV